MIATSINFISKFEDRYIAIKIEFSNLVVISVVKNGQFQMNICKKCCTDQNYSNKLFVGDHKNKPRLTIKYKL